MKATMTIKELETAIASLAKAEKITKGVLGTLSRELLAHCIEHKDASLVNKVMSADTLSPANLRIARLYFREFMPFALVEVDRIVAGKATKELQAFKQFSERKADKIVPLVEEFLSNEENNIWTWQADNVQMEAKPKAYADKIAKLIEKALQDGEEGLTPAQILDAVIAGGCDVLAIVADLAKQEKAA